MVLDFCPFGCLLSSFSAAFCRFPSFWLPLSSLWLPCWARRSIRSPLNIGFEIYGFGFLSFWLPFVFLFGCFWSISVLLAAFCLLFRLLFVDFRSFGCLLSSLWLPCWACFSLCSPLNIGFEIYGFGLPFVLAAFCLPFRLLFVDFCPFGCLLSSLWLPCWARYFLCSPFNIGFEIYGFGFLSFWLPFVFLFGCFFVDFRPFGCLLSSFSAAFCRFPSFWLPFVFSLAALLGPLLPPQSLKYWF